MASPAAILSAYESGSIKKKIVSAIFASPIAVYSNAMPPLVNCAIAVIDISSSSASKLLKITEMLLQKEKTEIEYEVDGWIDIPSYKSKRERNLLIKHQ